MKTAAISLNPFSLMMEPEAVLLAMEQSPSLRGLKRRTLRPLDKPLIPLIQRLDDEELGDDFDLDELNLSTPDIDLND